MSKLDQRITRLEKAKGAEPEADKPNPEHLYLWCIAEGWPAPKPKPGETLAEWLEWVPDETLGLMRGEPMLRHPMSSPSRAELKRHDRIEARIREDA